MKAKTIQFWFWKTC